MAANAIFLLFLLTTSLGVALGFRVSSLRLHKASDDLQTNEGGLKAPDFNNGAPVTSHAPALPKPPLTIAGDPSGTGGPGQGWRRQCRGGGGLGGVAEFFDGAWHTSMGRWLGRIGCSCIVVVLVLQVPKLALLISSLLLVCNLVLCLGASVMPQVLEHTFDHFWAEHRYYYLEWMLAGGLGLLPLLIVRAAQCPRRLLLVGGIVAHCSIIACFIHAATLPPETRVDVVILMIEASLCIGLIVRCVLFIVRGKAMMEPNLPYGHCTPLEWLICFTVWHISFALRYSVVWATLLDGLLWLVMLLLQRLDSEPRSLECYFIFAYNLTVFSAIGTGMAYEVRLILPGSKAEAAEIACTEEVTFSSSAFAFFVLCANFLWSLLCAFWCALVGQSDEISTGPFHNIFRTVSALADDILALDNLPIKVRGPSEMNLALPLPHYWVNSSHNTYLAGNQLSSPASPEAIVSALLQGCRVVELDIYDSKDGPCVKHGGTMTRPTSLESCLKAVREAAFVASPSPVILTLENYTGDEGQRQCAQLLHSVLGQALYVPPPRREGKEEGFRLPERWPTVGELQQRIVIRDKGVKLATLSVPVQPLVAAMGLPSDEALPSHWVADRSPSQPVVVSVRVPEFLRLIAIHNVKCESCEDIQRASSQHSGCLSSSLSEGSLQRRLKMEGLAKWRGSLTNHLCRIFPAGVRVDSSNYDPQDAWEAGCQVVALNFQGGWFAADRPLWLNAGKFRGNGGCGYVPKPAHLVGLPEKAAAQPRSGKLCVTVLSGVGWESFVDLDALRTPRSYVCVEVAGVASDRRVAHTQTCRCEARTGEKSQPVWGDDFDFRVKDLDLAVVLVTAWDGAAVSHRFLGQYGFPLAELRPGWRRVPLLDTAGAAQSHNPAVICKFELQTEGLWAQTAEALKRWASQRNGAEEDFGEVAEELPQSGPCSNYPCELAGSGAGEGFVPEWGVPIQQPKKVKSDWDIATGMSASFNKIFKPR